jgi:hypothetical protein
MDFLFMTYTVHKDALRNFFEFVAKFEDIL